MEDSPITEKANTSQNKNNWLDLCRALAITLVLFGHGRYFLTPAFKIAEALAFAAYLGVELFFVLSGFLPLYWVNAYCPLFSRKMRIFF